MSTGISISSINRIKELAEEKKYAEALEILDTQNLDKSINPQFLRISGEIFRENKRYYDSRRILLKSHEMSPQGTRIIAELIQLYLELGYYTRAKKYYEQYLFYSTEEDTQRDYVEYMYKKATGVDVKELASILIPILEGMPEDKWNFEAVLLYDKLDRKDRALEEARYILEHFKDSQYVKPVIEYIDDKLDVDEYFYVYPKEEVPEDKELYGDLIEKEEKILEADHYRMYPPEAKIIVEVDDKDAIESKPSKEKKAKKKRKSAKLEEKSAKDEAVKAEAKSTGDEVQSENTDEIKESDKKPDDSKQRNDKEDKSSENSGKADDNLSESTKQEDNAEELERKRIEEEEALKKKEREAALEKILSKTKNIDKESIKESAKQMVKNVGEDTKKARQQVKKVTGSVMDNVQKATDSLSDAVGTAKVQQTFEKSGEEFVDGIIESVIEPPKKSVGEVVTNEELDALVPDSLEAMSTEEVAEIEARKEEQEREELEELEAAVEAEESKKKKRRKKKRKESELDETENIGDNPQVDSDEKNVDSDNKRADSDKTDTDSNKTDGDSDKNNDNSNDESKDKAEDVIVADSSIQSEVIATVTFAELREKFLAANEEKEDEEEKPLESLGFISVVQSDVDEKLENDSPETAEILHRMINNKEYYAGEDSRGFESKASYENHGFEVENFDFDEYINPSVEPEIITTDEKIYKVEEIYSENTVEEFDFIAPEQDIKVDDVVDEVTVKPEEIVESIEENSIEPEEVRENLEEATAEAEEVTENLEEATAEPEEVMEIVEEATAEPEEVTEIVEEASVEPEEVREIVEEATAEPEEVREIVEEATVEPEPMTEVVEEATVEPEEVREIVEETNVEPEPMTEALEETTSEAEDVINIDDFNNRDMLRFRIVLTERMVKGLLDLKESR